MARAPGSSCRAIGCCTASNCSGLGGAAGRFDPGDHTAGIVQPSASAQRQQLLIAELEAEDPGRLSPGPAMQRLGVEQQAIEVEQAGRGAGHGRILSVHNDVVSPSTR